MITPAYTHADFRAHTCRIRAHKQYFPSNCKIRFQTSRSGEIKSFLGISLCGRMQTNGHAHVCVCVCTDYCVCVCVRGMRESFENMKDCLCIHSHGNPWYQYRDHISMSQCNYLSIRAASLSDTQTHTHTFQCLSFQQFVLARTCVSLYGPHFEYWLGYSLPVIRQQFFLPCSIVCVCVCVCVCPSEIERERDIGMDNYRRTQEYNQPFVRTQKHKHTQPNRERERHTHRDRF
jgi:hypothetical protein